MAHDYLDVKDFRGALSPFDAALSLGENARFLTLHCKLPEDQAQEFKFTIFIHNETTTDKPAIRIELTEIFEAPFAKLFTTYESVRAVLTEEERRTGRIRLENVKVFDPYLEVEHWTAAALMTAPEVNLIAKGLEKMAEYATTRMAELRRQYLVRCNYLGDLFSVENKKLLPGQMASMKTRLTGKEFPDE